MSLVYCSQGHANVSTHRFCSTCGEKLAVSTLLGNRYQIIQELGRGGFGRTYLAKDRNRFDETCVLKEFAPQVQGSEALQKAEELFAREAGVLYSLYHPQIPRFRELFRATWEGRDRLFLVQDYVEGLTYRQLLDARKLEDRLFSEQEGRQLLAQLLPVLDYIHRMGVIHRDISPENLIHRSNDQIPVLIDFGGVKQVAATATKKYVQQSKPPVSESTLQAAAVTRLGKVGYAPIEQIESGTVSPQSDLYALAVTVLVLCSGQEPPVLIDPTGRSTPWLSQLSLSPDFTTVLGRMLTDQPDRFSSAAEVWQALQPFSPKLPDARMGYGAGQPIAGQPIAGQPIAPATNHSPPGFASPVSAAPVFTNPQATYPVAQPGNSFAVGQLNTGQLNTGQLNTGQSGQPSHSIPIRPVRFQGWKTVLWFLLPISLGVGLALTAGWWLQQAGWFPDFTLQPDSSPNSPSPDSSSPDSSSPDSLSPLEQAAQTAGIDYGFLVQLTDATFRSRYPAAADRTLSDRPEDAEGRRIWGEIADAWLTQLPQILSDSSRQQLGRYRQADQEQWQQTIYPLYVGNRSLEFLTDAQFFHQFPEQRDQEFWQQPIGQVWYAMAADQVQALVAGETLEEIQFAQGTFSDQVEHTLEPGSGRVYIANLSAEQILRLNLQVPPNRSRLSLYLPRPTAAQPFLLDQSDQTTWVGTLPQSGYYEIVVINQSEQPIRYQLNLAVDNVISEPD